MRRPRLLRAEQPSSPGIPKRLRAALSSILGGTGLVGQRVDLPTVWLLQVSERAYGDLKVPPAKRGDIAALKDDHPILRTFFDDLAQEDNVDNGTLLRVVKRPMVFRIKASDERAAVWYDREYGVVWCCRVVALADYSSEGHAYNAFGAMEGDPNKVPPRPPVLYPEPAERRRAGGEQRLQSVIAALLVAREQARLDAGDWAEAIIKRPDGESERVGRALVEVEEVDASGDIVTSFILVLDRWPDGLPRPADWRARIIAQCFSTAEPVTPAYQGLPPGTHLKPGEVPLVQRVAELH